MKSKTEINNIQTLQDNDICPSIKQYKIILKPLLWQHCTV